MKNLKNRAMNTRNRAFVAVVSVTTVLAALLGASWGTKHL